MVFKLSTQKFLKNGRSKDGHKKEPNSVFSDGGSPFSPSWNGPLSLLLLQIQTYCFVCSCQLFTRLFLLWDTGHSCHKTQFIVKGVCTFLVALLILPLFAICSMVLLKKRPPFLLQLPGCFFLWALKQPLPRPSVRAPPGSPHLSWPHPRLPTAPPPMPHFSRSASASRPGLPPGPVHLPLWFLPLTPGWSSLSVPVQDQWGLNPGMWWRLDFSRAPALAFLSGSLVSLLSSLSAGVVRHWTLWEAHFFVPHQANPLHKYVSSGKTALKVWW